MERCAEKLCSWLVNQGLENRVLDLGETVRIRELVFKASFRKAMKKEQAEVEGNMYQEEKEI